MEPSVVDVMLKTGELPNFKRLEARGGYQRLRSTIPPQSPVAWASFATCKEPGLHGVFDFLRRNVRAYTPSPGVGFTRHPELAPDGSVSKPAHSLNFRQGRTFWSVADQHGVRCKLLYVPFSYPADDLKAGQMLCGEGVPDIRGYTTTFFSLSDSFTEQQLEERVSGGVRLPLRFEGDSATVQVSGAVDPRQGPQYYVKAPMRVTADRTGHRVSIEIQGQAETIAEGAWSRWFEWTFQVTPKYGVRAISRVHALEVGERVRLYMTSLQFHPKEPYVAFSEPAEYSGELADRYGLYKTLGWAYDTHALRQDGLSEDVFLDDARQTDAWVEKLTLDELDRGGFDMLIAVWTSTDRIAHMFWRFRDPKHPLYTPEGAQRYGRILEETYQQMDAIVGRVMDKLRDDDLLIVLSDHGFHSFRRGFNVNTWLIRNGYLVVKEQSDPETAYTEKEFLQGFDWSKSRAYALGLGSIYLNQKGREVGGIVDPADAANVISELREKLLQVVDPETGERIFTGIYTKEDFGGQPTVDTPDIQLGYAEGYQSSKTAAKGGAPRDLFEPNTDKWSGDHGASDVKSSPGILFASRPLAPNAAILDLGVTALTFFDVPVPPDFQGKSLL